MILLWNRREIYNGFSLYEFNRIRDILIAKGINYDFKMVNRTTSSVFDTTRSRIGSYGENNKYSNEYYVYVHKNDYDEAVYMISNNKI